MVDINFKLLFDNSRELLVNMHRLNDIRKINQHLLTAYSKLESGGLFVGNFIPLEKLKSQEEPVVEAVVEEVEEKEEPSNIPDYKGMSKKKLEETMRSYGIELDRRKSKSALLEEVEMFFDGKLT